MKTSNNAQETGNRKFKNSISLTFAVVCLILISLTVSAGKSGRQLQENNKSEKRTLMTVDTQTESSELLAFVSLSEIASKTFFIESSKDKYLEIENWMTNSTYFGLNDFTDQISSEKSLEIENWMIENSYFAMPVISTDCEPDAKIEDWMINESIWKNQN
ncbi:MAG TPA: hypothetical protein VFC65_14785 [Prolixibacteraceae bacterium]|nr:hypothetical protein [Prolixibacteraceae bacterium]